MACEKIPILRELAAIVSFSPSLRTAVENKYVQPVCFEKNGERRNPAFGISYRRHRLMKSNHLRS